MEELAIGNRKCHRLVFGESGPTVFWGMKCFSDDVIPNIEREARQLLSEKSVQIIAFEADDWDGEFSPWEAAKPDGCGRFKGNGRETLNWILNDAVAFVRSNTAAFSERFFTAGYSLSGLFALWTMCESNDISGCACCSGSLWYEDFDKYIDSAEIAGGKLVYLSLGGKEHNTKNPIMSTIEEKTKTIFTALSDNKFVNKTVFVLNPGGHFKDTEKRVAKGICWLLDSMQ